MPSHNQINDTIYENLKDGIDNKVLHLAVTGRNFDGRYLEIAGKSMLNFASYSYMGFEVDPRLKEAGMKGFENFGSQFGMSRAYASLSIYEELESLLTRIFKNKTLVAPSTTLAHQAVLPVVVRDEDYVILDQQVHASVQMTSKILKERGIPVELLRHNRIDLLEERIKKLRQKYRKVWYFLDGLYSMNGDFAPLEEIEKLMNTYEEFWIYVDDAHGMSWTGENGAGYVLSQVKQHSQMVLVTSLNKGFASAGGAIVLPNDQLYDDVKTCGGTLIFSTPVQPPMITSGIASAKIHLSDEMKHLQGYFSTRVAYCHQLLKELELPDLSDPTSPIFFVATSLPKVTYQVINKMIAEGFFVNAAIFPAVSMTKSGVRICININHSLNDIRNMLLSLKRNYDLVLKETDMTLEKVLKAFKISPPKTTGHQITSTSNNGLKIETVTDVCQIRQEEWDAMFKYRGSFSHEGIQFLQNTYSNNERDEDNWEFYFILIRDKDHNIVLATFLTHCLLKEDIFAHKETSRKIEETRLSDPHFLISKCLLMGSQLTEGNHLYIDGHSEYTEEALQLLINEIDGLQSKLKVNQIIFRDFEDDFKFKNLLIGEGFVKVDLPNTNIIKNDILTFNSTEEYLSKLSANSRKKIKEHAIRYEKYYNVEIIHNTEVSEDELEEWYQLYLQIKNKSFEINTFKAPKKLFHEALKDKNWEFLKLSLKKEYAENGVSPILAIGLIFKTDKTYSPMLLGLDYNYQQEFSNYRQAIFQAVKRANQLGLETVFMGFTADIEKRNFGAEAAHRIAFVQANDTFNLNMIEMIK